MSNRANQIIWIVDKFYGDEMINLAASNMTLQDTFAEEFGDISDRLWKDRIKAAATICGLTGTKLFYGCGEAWTRWEIVYS